MPRASASPTLKRAVPATAEAQVATANTTANAFLGSRRPAWLTSSVRQPVIPAAAASSATVASPATVPAVETHVPSSPALSLSDPKAITTNLSQQSDTSLLSPAPTDEASPAAAGSPAIVIVEEANAEDASATRAGVPFSEDRQQLPPENAGASDFTPRIVEEEAPGQRTRSSTTTIGSPRTPAQAVTNPPQLAQNGLQRHPLIEVVSSEPAVDMAIEPRMEQTTEGREPTPPTPAGQARFALIETTQAEPRPFTIQATRPEEGDPSNAQDDQRNPYYPRVVARKRTRSLTFSFRPFIPTVQQQMKSRGAADSNLSHTEALRLSTLAKACEVEDDFFIALNQLTSLWLLDRDEVYNRLSSLTPAVIDRGCEVVRGVLETYGHVQPTLLRWLSQFPRPIDYMLREPIAYQESITAVGAFLQRVVQHWTKLLEKVLVRKYPILVDEYICVLLCISPAMQTFLSVASRRELVLAEGAGIMDINRVLVADQVQHQPVPGVFIGLPEDRFPGDFKTVNADIITAYRAIFVQNKAGPPKQQNTPQTNSNEQSRANTTQLPQLRVPPNNTPQGPVQQVQKTGSDTVTARRNTAQDTTSANTTTAAHFPIAASNIIPARRASGSPQIDASRAQAVRPAQNRTPSLDHGRTTQQALISAASTSGQRNHRIVSPHLVGVPPVQSPLSAHLAQKPPPAPASPQITYVQSTQTLQTATARQQAAQKRWEAEQAQHAIQLQRQQMQMQYLQARNPTQNMAGPDTSQTLTQLPNLHPSGQHVPSQQVPSQQVPNQQVLSKQAPSQQVPSQQFAGQQALSQRDPSQQVHRQQVPSQRGQQPPGQHVPGQHVPGQQLSGQQPSNNVPLTEQQQQELLMLQQAQQLEQLQELHRLQREQQLEQLRKMSTTHQVTENTIQSAQQTLYGHQGQHGRSMQPLQQPMQQSAQAQQAHQAHQAAQTNRALQAQQALQAQRVLQAQQVLQEQQFQQAQQLHQAQQAQSAQQTHAQQLQHAQRALQARQAAVQVQAQRAFQAQHSQQGQVQTPHQRAMYEQYVRMQQQERLQGQQVAPVVIQPPALPRLEQWRQPTQPATNAPAQTVHMAGNRAPGQILLPQNTLRSPAPSPVQSPNLAQHVYPPPGPELSVQARNQPINATAVSTNAAIQRHNIAGFSAQQASVGVPSQPQSQLELQRVQGQLPQTPVTPMVAVGDGRARQSDPTRPAEATIQVHRSIFPPTGFTISRSEYPIAPNDYRAVQMSLLQLDRRNPRQVLINRTTKKELPPKTGNPVFYQYIQRMAVGPNPTPMNKIMYNLQFLVTEEEHALRSYRSTPEGQLLSIENVFDGSLGYRVRCCAARRNVKSMSESEWIVTNTKWPVNIFIKVNGSPVFVRRQSHNGKDLPVSITELIHVGVNRVEVAIPEESHKAGPRPNFFFGVEIIETAHCNRTVDNIKKYGVHDASVTINKINTRLQTTTSEDDEFAVLQDSISVDLADPFSAKIFKIPVRGVQCQHIECFDMYNWLNTRPPGAPATTNCQHLVDCQCPRSQEPTLPDKWRCPICSKDARPSSLRIDKFLVDVRAKLKEMGKLDKVKSILVGLDGKWESVAIVDDDPEGDDNDDAGVISGKRKAEDTRTEQPPRKLIRMASDPNVTTSARRTASAAQPPRAIDIIEIDD